MNRIIALLLLFIPFITDAKAIEEYEIEATVIRVYDGDTFTVNIPGVPKVFGEEIGVRINGIDTPELTDKREHIYKKAVEAKNYLTNRLSNANKIMLTNLKRDKYFRLNATVIIDGSDVAKELLELHLAKPYNGGKKDPW